MSGVQSIERAFALLRALATGPSGVTDLAERTDLPKSTVSRLLSALEVEGAVQQVESGGDYVLGPLLAELAGSVAPDASIGAIVQPFLTELAAQTSGSAGFTIRDGNDLVWIDNVDPDDEVVHVSDLSGSTFPLHTVPSGIAVLSALPDGEVDEYVATPLRPHFDEESGIATPTADAVRARVRAARSAGVVTSYGDLIPDVTGFAVPLCDAAGPVGGLYVQGPSFRFPQPDTARAVEELLVAVAEQINDRLAHR